MAYIKTVIEPNAKNMQYWKDLWRYRGLAINFAKRDITVRYKQTIIGLGWSIISPLVNMIVMTVIFGNLASFTSEPGVPYHIMVYAGLLPWGLFARCLSATSSTFINSAALMKKVYFPRIISPLASCISGLIDTMVSFCVFLLLMIIFQFTPSIRILLSPLILIWCMLLGFGAGLTLSAYNIRFRDLNQIVPFIIQLGQYASPVAYSFETVPERWRMLYSLNPVTGLLNTFKWCIMDTADFYLIPFLITVVWTVGLLLFGIYKFRKAERTFVDIV